MGKTLTLASTPSSASADSSTSNEDDEGLDQENELLGPQQALGEIDDAATDWEFRGKPPPNGDLGRFRSLFVRVEVGIEQERRRNIAASAVGTVVTLEKDPDSQALGPVKSHQGPELLLAFRNLVFRELFERHGDFVKAYRAPQLELIQAKASSVLASKSKEN